MNMIDDPIVGVLKCDDKNRYREFSIGLFGREYQVSLNFRGGLQEPILETQYRAYAQINDISICSQIEDSIVAYYLSELEELRAMYETDADKVAPLIKNKKELGALVSLIAIIIPQNRRNSEIDMIFECTWDLDWGVGVRVLNGEVQETGTQHVAITD